jgi:hypothetical protein
LKEKTLDHSRPTLTNRGHSVFPLFCALQRFSGEAMLASTGFDAAMGYHGPFIPEASLQHDDRLFGQLFRQLCWPPCCFVGFLPLLKLATIHPASIGTRSGFDENFGSKQVVAFLCQYSMAKECHNLFVPEFLHVESSLSRSMESSCNSATSPIFSMEVDHHTLMIPSIDAPSFRILGLHKAKSFGGNKAHQNHTVPPTKYIGTRAKATGTTEQLDKLEEALVVWISFWPKVP